MADLSKHSVVESLNISSSANHSVQSAQSVSTSSEYNLNVSAVHSIILQPSSDIYYGFSSSASDMISTSNSLYLAGGDTIYELNVPQGIGSTVYLHLLGKGATATVRIVLA
jgi:hypothetical protein|tara:strand:+ start:1463 stop:1795 length:333 start_codon:yes stop_codon:yes gene_type:complete